MAQNKNTPSVMICLAILFAPSIALANSGAPLLGFMELAIIPAAIVIPLLESAALRIFFKCPFFRSILWTFLGNFLSYMAGLFLVSITALWNITIYDLLLNSIARWTGAFALSVLIEFPFYLGLFCVAFKENRLKRALKACLIIHVGFYVLVAPYYLYCAYFAVLGGYHTTHDLSFMKSPTAWVYYISPSCDAVIRCRPDGTQTERAYTLSKRTDPQYASLWLKKSDSRDSWDLLIAGNSQSNTSMSTNSEDLLVRNFCPKDAWMLPSDKYSYDISFHGPQFCADLRSSDSRSIKFSLGGRWYLYLDDYRPGKEGGNLLMQSPTWDWPIRNLTTLEGDKLIFQLGDQICALDYPSRRIGVIAYGYRPIVVLDVE
ncbi:MAG: hypothetical protein NTX50_29065 [Candidatus Sumerlaeota bacterium]|nr:hypothetical protein [Candidatus Sumerlaeota bacterium]